jgi:hypothetical protein
MWLYYRFWLVIGFNDSHFPQIPIQYHFTVCCITLPWYLVGSVLTDMSQGYGLGWRGLFRMCSIMADPGTDWHTAELLLAFASAVILILSPTGLMTILYCLTALGVFRPSLPPWCWLTDWLTDRLAAHLPTLRHWSFSGLSYRSLVGIFLYSDMDHTIVVTALDSPFLIVLPYSHEICLFCFTKVLMDQWGCLTFDTWSTRPSSMKIHSTHHFCVLHGINRIQII